MKNTLQKYLQTMVTEARLGSMRKSVQYRRRLLALSGREFHAEQIVWIDYFLVLLVVYLGKSIKNFYSLVQKVIIKKNHQPTKPCRFPTARQLKHNGNSIDFQWGKLQGTNYLCSRIVAWSAATHWGANEMYFNPCMQYASDKSIRITFFSF